MSTSSGREVVSSSDEGFAEDLHSNTSDSSPNNLLDSLSPASRDDFDAINVVVRVRPSDKANRESCPRKINCRASNTGGQDKQDEQDLFPAAGQIQMTDPQSGTLKSFTFDVIFEPEASQEQVFEHSRLKKFIDMSLEGFASTVFAYGQTGSGKTFTMFGNVFSEHRLVDNDKQHEVTDYAYLKHKNKSATGKGKKNQESSAEVVGIVQFSFA